MRILTFTTLYPNGRQPAHGIFVENRLRHLVAGGDMASRVVAPVPWFPWTNRCFGRYAALAAVPVVEERGGIVVHHPRYLQVPKIGMTLAPTLLYAATRRLARRLLAAEDFDLIDAHYFYPDGVAAILLGREMGKPVVITARGSDLSLFPRYALPRRQIVWAARRAAGLVTVCQALKMALVDLGIPPQSVRVLRNGVDLTLFHPGDREEARRRLAVSPRTLVSVGLLIPRKGHDVVIRALARLPDVSLLIVGEGPERPALERLVRQMDLSGRVRFLGRVPHAELPMVYRAADALVLASSREGWANVLLEAMACGTPVVASPVWGNVEVVAAPAAGLIAAGRTPEAIGWAIERLLAQPPRRADTRAYAEAFSWEATTIGQQELFREILAGKQAPLEQAPRLKSMAAR